MIQNPIFNKFLQHQLNCYGTFTHSLVYKLQTQRWLRSEISDKDVIREFISILKRQGINYSIRRQVSSLGDNWDGFEIVVNKGK